MASPSYPPTTSARHSTLILPNICHIMYTLMQMPVVNGLCITSDRLRVAGRGATAVQVNRGDSSGFRCDVRILPPPAVRFTSI